MAQGLYTSQHDWMNEYTAHLSADLGSSDTDIFLDTVPTPTEGCLVIDPDTPASTEIIFYTSKTSSKVTVPSVANGRGYDSTSATTHTSGTKVIMAPIADDFRYIRTVATTTPQGWTPLASAPNTVTANGNRSYTCVFNAVDYSATLSPGMRFRTTRTVAAPTQCTSLNGTTQYYSRASASLGTTMTFTNNFVVSAWVKLTAYQTSNTIASRYNGTSGWSFDINSSGQVRLLGYNAGAANFSQILSYQSVPLNKWVHLSAQLDMATFTATTTTSYVMIDGVDVPAAVSRGGTNPTTLIQAGNLEIGSVNAGTFPFPGKIAQVAIYSAKVTQANILATISQGLAGTETSLISAYSFNNSINDLNANANNLTANGSAVATNADSPFGYQAGGAISSTLDYGIIQSVAFSTNTTVVVQVAEGCTIPTSGGVSAVSYSTQKAPYGFPGNTDKFNLIWIQGGASNTINTSTFTSSTGSLYTLPTGAWEAIASIAVSTSSIDHYTALSSSTTTVSDGQLVTRAYQNATTLRIFRITITGAINTSTATVYNLIFHTGAGGNGNILGRSDDSNSYSYITYKNAYL